MRMPALKWHRYMAGAVVGRVFADLMGIGGSLNSAATDGQWSPLQYWLASLVCYGWVMTVGAAVATLYDVPLTWPRCGGKRLSHAIAPICGTTMSIVE